MVVVERLWRLKKLPTFCAGISTIGRLPCGVTSAVSALAWKVDSSTSLLDSGA
jgi:hypothetical protein